MGQGESVRCNFALLCLRGSRTPRKRNLDAKDRDLEIENSRTSLDSTAIDTLLLGYLDTLLLRVYRVRSRKSG